MNKPLFLVLLLLMPVFLIQAQSEKEEPKPSEPVLKRAPSNSEWTIWFYRDRQKALETLSKSEQNQEKAEKAVGAKQPKSLTVTKNGRAYREVVLWGDGRTTEKWISDGLQVYETPNSKRIARSVIPASHYSDSYSDYRRSDFEELEWIGKENFVGVKDLGGRKVFEFRAEAVKRRLTPREAANLINPDANESPAELLKRHQAEVANAPGYMAYLDLLTQLPVYFDDGQTARVYEFAERPPERLVIPPRFQAELDTWKKELNRWKPLPLR